tara:strand:- start:1286 stop:1564 length:279 start_codon:yes stop_codon:yes gene_type:complete
MIKYLLDINICIYVIKNRPLEVLSKFNDSAGRMAIWSISLAELLHRCEKSQKVKHDTRQVEDFCSKLEVLSMATMQRNIMVQLELIWKSPAR